MEGAFYREEVDKPKFESSAAPHGHQKLRTDQMVGTLNLRVNKLRLHISAAVTAAKDLTNMIKNEFPNDKRKSLLIKAYFHSSDDKSEFYTEKMLGNSEKTGILQELSTLAKEIHKANEFIVSLNNDMADKFNDKYSMYLKTTEEEEKTKSRIRTLKFLAGQNTTRLQMEGQKKDIVKGSQQIIKDVSTFKQVFKNGHEEKINLIEKFIAALKKAEDNLNLQTDAIVSQTVNESMSLSGHVNVFYATYNKQGENDKKEFYNEISDEINNITNEES